MSSWNFPLIDQAAVLELCDDSVERRERGPHGRECSEAGWQEIDQISLLLLKAAETNLSKQINRG